MTGRASLPMYDLPELRAAQDDLWRSLAGAFRAAGVGGVPGRLTRDRPVAALWRDRDLLFSQSCGYPLTHDFADWLRPVATPVYAAEGCDGPLYRSAVVVPADSAVESLADCRGAVCAVNGWGSLSGWHALAALAAPLVPDGGFFGAGQVTGGHLASLAAVAEGRAGLAALDAVSWALFQRHRPALARRVRVLCWTEPAPGLPFVTRADADGRLLDGLRAGVAAMLADADAAAARRALLIDGAEPLTEADYAPVPEIARRGATLRLPAFEAA
ncbi:MAG: PhnD/SsuA/transferrin family substrate-binding protein [Inquilinus sp.]|nr:PhnD/SsuA/transferrin family substrate-binding protein [Inquilinus sp.]